MKPHNIAVLFAGGLILMASANALAAPLQYQLVNLGSSSAYSYAEGLNDLGQVVGIWEPSAYNDGFIYSYSNGTRQIVSLPTDTQLNAINNSGVAVGWFGGLQGEGFSDTNGSLNYPLPVSASYSSPQAINAAGQITGYATFGNRVDPFIYSNGNGTDLGFAGAAYAINSNGEVVGTLGPGANDAFTYINGQKTDIGVPSGALDAIAHGVNDSGEVVGYSQGQAGFFAWLYNNGVYTSLGTLGGVGGEAMGINNAGTIVGYAASASTGQNAFVDYGGVMYDLNDLLDSSGAGWTLTEAVAINSNGWIIADGGSSMVNNDRTGAVLLIPFPSHRA